MDSLAEMIVKLAGISMIVVVVIGPIWIGSYYRSRERARLHETLRLMVEKGQPVSGELLESLRAGGGGRSASSDMRRGVMLMAIALAIGGFGLALGLGGEGEAVGPVCGAAAFPAFIGLAFIVMALVGRDKPKV